MVASIKPNKPDIKPLITDFASKVAMIVIPKIATQNSSVDINLSDNAARGGVKKMSIKTPKTPPTKELMKQ